MKKELFGATALAAGLVLGAAPANAALSGGDCFLGSCGTIGIDYGSASPTTGSSGDLYGFSTSQLMRFGNMWSGQVDFGYHRITLGSGSGVDNFNAAASGIYNFGSWRAGGSYGYQSTSNSFAGLDASNYGAFAQVFVSPDFTLAGKLGGFSTLGTNSYYTGALGTWYPNPNLALSAGVDYADFNNGEKDYSLGFEYLLKLGSVPFSFSTKYVRTDFTTGTFHLDTFFIGLTFWCDDHGAVTLKQRQDTGPVGWGTTYQPLGLKF